MTDSEYTKIYDGNFILVNRIKGELEAMGIIPFIKDIGESNRLSGYPISHNDFIEVFVTHEDYDKAMIIVNRVKAEMEAAS